MNTKKYLSGIFILTQILAGCNNDRSSKGDGKDFSKPDPDFVVEFDAQVPEIPEGLRISTFDIDVTPPVGTWLAYDSTRNTWDLGPEGKGDCYTRRRKAGCSLCG